MLIETKITASNASITCTQNKRNLCIKYEYNIKQDLQHRVWLYTANCSAFNTWWAKIFMLKTISAFYCKINRILCYRKNMCKVSFQISE